MLNSTQLEEVYKWLQENNMSTIRLPRQFSNCVALANLLKKFRPKLVDLCIYANCSCTSRKLANWEVFNLKVLKKLNLQLRKPDMEKLANATPGAIENLLYKIMKLVKEVEVDKVNKQEPISATKEITEETSDALGKVPEKMTLPLVHKAKCMKNQANGADPKKDTNPKNDESKDAQALAIEPIERVEGGSSDLSIMNSLDKQNTEESEQSRQQHNEELDFWELLSHFWY